MKTLNILFVALAVAVLVAGPAAATEKTDVMATVLQFVEGFNKGDAKTILAACADQTSIVDEFPPHEWHGAGACSNWANDFDAYIKRNGITDGIITLDNPRHVDVTADRAYVVVPASFSFKQNGKLAKEPGALLTFALQKGATGWRITGWTWTAR